MNIPNHPIRLIGTGLAIGALSLGAGHLAPAFSASAAPEAVPEQVEATAPASAFVPLSGYRSYDSRIDADESGKIYLQEQRFVDVAVDLDGEEQIPDEATAVTFNVTVTETESAGFVQVSPPGNEFGETSTVNWTGDGQTVANGGHALMYEGPTFENNIVFHVDGAGGAGAHVIIDVTGYFVPID
jgi:hypothetical protein